MKKINQHQLITFICLPIYVFFAVLIQDYKGLTINFTYLIFETLLPALFFIYFPLFTINLIKKGFKKESLSQFSKSLIVSLMILFLFFSLYANYTNYKEVSKYYDIRTGQPK
jgi:hypothetical protein